MPNRDPPWLVVPNKLPPWLGVPNKVPLWLVVPNNGGGLTVCSFELTFLSFKSPPVKENPWFEGLV